MKLYSSIATVGVVAAIVCGQFLQSHKTDLTPADLIATIRGSVVHIEKVGVCQGSGCIISADGLIITAKHITDGGGLFNVTLDDGRVYSTSVVVEHVDYDLAFLKIESETPLEFASLGNMDDMRSGDTVFIMGSPMGYVNINSVSMGIISYMYRDLESVFNYGYGWSVIFQTDATALPGNSGGPVFNENGEVVGILVAGFSETVNYAVPTWLIIANLDSIVSLANSDKYVVYTDVPVYAPEDEMYGF